MKADHTDRPHDEEVNEMSRRMSHAEAVEFADVIAELRLGRKQSRKARRHAAWVRFEELLDSVPPGAANRLGG